MSIALSNFSRLDDNKDLSMKRHQHLERLIGQTKQQIVKREQDLVRIMISVNDHVTVLRDREEKCDQYRE